jgi:hypothetical protein
MLVVDQASMNKVTVDPNYKIQSRLFQGISVRGVISVSSIERFKLMLTNDPAHMMPRERSQAVSFIQFALMYIHETNEYTIFGSRGKVTNEYDNFQYGQISQTLVKAQKIKYNIFNYTNEIDPIVGKKTIRALDFILYRHGK